jgi:hypothetical protein
MNSECRTDAPPACSQFSYPNVSSEHRDLLFEMVIRAIGDLTCDLYFDKSVTLEYLRRVWSYQLASIYKQLKMFLETSDFESSCPIYKWLRRTMEILKNCKDVMEALKEKEHLGLD